MGIVKILAVNEGGHCYFFLNMVNYDIKSQVRPVLPAELSGYLAGG